MNSLALKRTDSLRLPTSPAIDRPHDTVVLEGDHAGKIRCKHLIVLAGVRAELMVEAEQVNLAGEVSGSIRSQVLTVATEGAFIGQCATVRLNVAGRVNGLVHARMIVARASAAIEGEVIADRLERQPSTFLLANIAVGPGMADRRDLVAAARLRLEGESPTPAKPAVRPSAVILQVPASAPISVDRDASFRSDAPSSAPRARAVPSLIPHK